MMSSQGYILSKKAFISTANIYILHFVFKLLWNKWEFIIKMNNLFPFTIYMLYICILHAVYLMSSFS